MGNGEKNGGMIFFIMGMQHKAVGRNFSEGVRAWPSEGG